MASLEKAQVTQEQVKAAEDKVKRLRKEGATKEAVSPLTNHRLVVLIIT